MCPKVKVRVGHDTLFSKAAEHAKFHDSRAYSKRNITLTRFSIIDVKGQGQIDLILVDCTPYS